MCERGGRRHALAGGLRAVKLPAKRDDAGNRIRGFAAPSGKAPLEPMQQLLADRYARTRQVRQAREEKCEPASASAFRRDGVGHSSARATDLARRAGAKR